MLTKAPHGRVRDELDASGLALPERWILAAVNDTAEKVSRHLEEFRFDLACHHLYQFFWSDFCDWYIEMSKPGLEPATARPRVDDVLVTVLDRALRLLHPVMPHITEELWQRLPGHESIHAETICLAPYPEYDEGLPLKEEEAEVVAEVQFIVQATRNGKKEAGLPDRARVAQVWLQPHGPEDAAFCAALAEPGIGAVIRRLTSAENIAVFDSAPEHATSRIRRERYVLHVLLAAAAAPQADAGKLREELEQVESVLRRVEERLASPGFTGKAPAAVIEGARKQLAELAARRTTLQSSLTGSLSVSSEE